MKITKLNQVLSKKAKPGIKKKKSLSVGEVWYLNRHLQMRYEILQTTNILKNFTTELDFRLILDSGVKILKAQIAVLEKLMQEYSIPLPPRYPLDVKSIAGAEMISDRYIFRTIFRGIQSFLPVHAEAFKGTTDPTLRGHFKKFLIEEIELYDGFIEYGKIKGYEVVPPRYKN